MKNHSPVTFKFGDADAFEKLKQKDENTVYFISDSNSNHRLYVGEECYNVTIIKNLESGNISDKSVPSTAATLAALNKKASLCSLVVSEDVELPEKLVLKNNTEYRYLNLSGAEKLTISIPKTYTPYLFYSSVTLYKVESSDSISDFVQIFSDTDDSENSTEASIRFLNGDVSLAGNNTAELLFFSNGRDVCCIAAVYNYEEEEDS